jgi:release factor glutamine methyltransferase
MMPKMTTSQWLSLATTQLEAAGIGTARLDALVLLEDTLNIDRAKLLAEPETEIEPVIIDKLINVLKRRATHEPLAFIRGFSEFYGRKFIVNQNVLEPRPESETMIDLLKELVDDPKSTISRLSDLYIADVGTGSGALGITAKLELPKCEVDLIDIDDGALSVAKTNVDLFTLNISIIKSDLLASTDSNYQVLLCNLPYVPDDYQINSSANFEPRIAIFGGTDGLYLYRKLFEQIVKRSNKPLYLLTECLPAQHADLRLIATLHGYFEFHEFEFIQVFELRLAAQLY